MADQFLPVYFVGRNISNARITPLIVAANGTFTKGSAHDIAGFSGGYLTFKSASFQQTAGSIEVSPANVTVENYVLTKDTFDVTLSEILYADPSNNALPAAWASYDHFLVEALIQPYQGGNSTPFTVQAPGVRAAFDNEFDEGNNPVTLHLKPCGLPVAYIPAGGSLVY